jgi:hypothetical protein
MEKISGLNLENPHDIEEIYPAIYLKSKPGLFLNPRYH